MAKKIIILYIFLASIFTLLLISVFAIPTSTIKNNIVESVKQIQKEGLWFQPLSFYLFQIDNMTDCLMMNINSSANSDNPIRSSMIVNYSQPYKYGDTGTYLKMDKTTLDIAENGANESTIFSDYARYWHGYQVVLRPLLYIFNYNQIRILNYITFFILLSITILLLYKRLNIIFALTFAATLVLSNIMIVPLAIQFSTCFYIAFIGMIFILYRKKTIDSKQSAVLFFTIGALTSYMDFLTTPILTLGFPLIVLIAKSERNKRINTMFRQTILWFIGYASIWSSKWLIGWILTGDNIINTAIGCAQQRIGNTIIYGGIEMPMSDFFEIMINTVSSIINPIWVIIILLSLIIIFTLYLYKVKTKVKANNWLLTIALMPIIWFIIMKNHSLQHIFFTWRDFMLTLWCMLIFAFSNTKTLKTQ